MKRSLPHWWSKICFNTLTSILLINILGYIVDIFLCYILLLFTAEIMPTVYTHSQASEWLSWKFSGQSAVRLVTGRIYCPQYGFWFSTGGHREVRGHVWCWAGECIESLVHAWDRSTGSMLCNMTQYEVRHSTLPPCGGLLMYLFDLHLRGSVQGMRQIF